MCSISFESKKVKGRLEINYKGTYTQSVMDVVLIYTAQFLLIATVTPFVSILPRQQAAAEIDTSRLI